MNIIDNEYDYNFNFLCKLVYRWLLYIYMKKMKY